MTIRKTVVRILYKDNIGDRCLSIRVKSLEDDFSHKDITSCIQTVNDNTSINGGKGDVPRDVAILDEGTSKRIEQADKKTSGYSTHSVVTFLTAAFVMLTTVGLMVSSGALFTYILEEFQESRASTAAIQSIYYGVGMCQKFCGVIVHRIGALKGGVLGAILYPAGLLVSVFATSTIYLQMSYGIISGLGLAFLYVGANQAVGECFTGKGKLLAVSVAVMAVGIGTVVYPYVIDWLVKSYGLKGTFLILGGVTLNSVPLAFTWHTSNHVTNIHAPGKRHRCQLLCGMWYDIVKVLKYPPFPFMMIGNGLGAGLITAFDFLSLDVVESIGMSRDQSIIAYVYLKAASIPARLVPGILDKIPGCNSVMTPAIGAILGAVGMITLNFASGFVGIVIIFVVNGLARGIMISCMSVVSLDMLGLAGFATGLGLVLCVGGIVVVASRPVIGLLRDISGSYLISLYGTSGLMFLSLVFCIISLVMHNRIQTKRNNIDRLDKESEPDYSV